MTLGAQLDVFFAKSLHRQTRWLRALGLLTLRGFVAVTVAIPLIVARLVFELPEKLLTLAFGGLCVALQQTQQRLWRVALEHDGLDRLIEE